MFTLLKQTFQILILSIRSIIVDRKGDYFIISVSPALSFVVVFCPIAFFMIGYDTLLSMPNPFTIA